MFADFNLDNSTAAGNSSGVHFSVHYNTPGVAITTGDGTAVNTPGVSYGLQVERLDIGSSLLGRTYHGHNGTNRTSAVVVLNARLSGCGGCEAFRMALAHEVGHTFNLDECYTCVPGVSIMNNPPSLCDTDHGLTTPSECDNARIRANGEYNPNTVNQPCPDLDHNGVGDCEEDSGDDDETDCYNIGGTWDPVTGNCDYFDCDPSGQQEAGCYSGGGVWNPENCNCGTSGANVCEPLGEQKVGEYLYYFETCSGPDLWSCIEQYSVMQQYYEPGDANSVCNTCDERVVYEGISCGLSGTCW